MASNSIWRALVLLSLCNAALAAKKPRHTLTWQSFECVPNPKYFTDVRCAIVEPARTHLNFDATSTEDFDATSTEDFDEYWTELTMLVPRPPDNKLVKILNFAINLCEMMAEMERQQMVRIVAESVLRHSNWPRRCPIGKGHYYHRNVSFVENLPEFFPETELRVHFKCFTHGNSLLNVTLSGRLTEVVRGWFTTVKKT